MQCDQCIIGKYGDLCSIDCPSNCDGKSCLKESGNCVKCLEKFAGVKCERCLTGLYGPTCSESCPSKCLNDICENKSGSCSYGCTGNYSGDRCCLNNNNCISCYSDTKCKVCKSGYFSESCNKKCQSNCTGSCDIETGRCETCQKHFYGDTCSLPCSTTCKNAPNVTVSLCNRETGNCKYGCSDGFYGPKCSKKCSILCVDNICDQENGKCTVGCQKIEEDQFCQVKPGNCFTVNI